MSGSMTRTLAATAGLSGLTWWLALTAVLVVLAAAAALYRRHRDRRALVRFPTRPASVSELAGRADRILRETDDAVHTCEQELAVAVAEYGEPPTTAFTRALADAQAELSAAFALRERLAETADETATCARLTEMLAHCEAANTRLDAMADEFDRLRRLVTRAAEALASVAGDAEAVAEAVEHARVRSAELAARYSGTALDGIADHVDLAQERLRFAEARIVEAGTAVRAGETCRAAVRVRAAEEAVGQARRLCAAVDRRDTELTEAASGLARLLADADRDIAQARRFQAAGHDAGEGLTEFIDRATAVTQQVRDSMRAEGYDPLVVSRNLVAVDEALDEALTEVRDAPLRMTWARAVLPSRLLSARSALAIAEDFVRVHRGGVGTGARAWLAHARRLCEEAVAATTDPVSALASAKQARQRAIQAWESARRDVADFGRQAVGPPDCAKAVLAGILIGSLWGGGHARSRGGPVVPGSFGGASTRARRGSGAGFGA